MSRLTAAEGVGAPLKPVIVNERVPGGVAVPVPTVIVEEAVAGLGLKLAVAPPGNPLTPKVTAAVKPPEGVMLTAYVVPAPCTTLWEAGLAERLKSGAGLTAKVTDTVCVRVPLTPVMVNA